MKNDLRLLYIVMLMGKVNKINYSSDITDIYYTFENSTELHRGRFRYSVNDCEIVYDKEIVEYWMSRFLG